MRNILLACMITLCTFSTNAQDITGQWNGVLKIQGTQLRVVFNVVKTNTGFKSTMDSPDQGAKGIHVTKTTYKESIVSFEISNIGVNYNGQVTNNLITGIFTQNGHVFPMELSREKSISKRPQHPKKPYSYYSENVIFTNPNSKTSLSGTLTLPKKEGVFPVVILISGSGAQNRDEELFDHKPFLVIADYLTKNGIGVLRYDDRGVGESKGNFHTATTADFADDVESAIAYLKTRKDINTHKIGLIGHSEGGVIAPMVASRSKDVAYIVLLAGTGIQGNELLLLQQELIAKATGVPEQDIKQSTQINTVIFDKVLTATNTKQLRIDVRKVIEESIDKNPDFNLPNGVRKDQFVRLQTNQITSPWMQYFLKLNPRIALEKVNCPVLALNGEKDLQVPPKENLTAIKDALTKGNNKNFTTKELPNLNHLFQECTTGAPSEYGRIEQTFSPIALQIINKWIQEQVK